MFEFTVAPGSKVPIAHSHDAYEETCYALEGTLTLTLWSPDGQPEIHETAPGDSLVIPRGIVHRFDNFSSEPTRTLAIITPGILGTATSARSPPSSPPPHRALRPTPKPSAKSCAATASPPAPGR
jgi:quercetin dioxygenase-like cupin family protein